MRPVTGTGQGRPLMNKPARFPVIGQNQAARRLAQPTLRLAKIIRLPTVQMHGGSKHQRSAGWHKAAYYFGTSRGWQLPLE